MHDGLILVARAVAGGVLVVVFALVGEVVKPKAFSGLYAAAPSVALASLAITVADQGTRRARQDAAGMVLGAVGMVACCIVAVVAIPRLKALWGTGVAWLGWFGVSLGLYWAVGGPR